MKTGFLLFAFLLLVAVPLSSSTLQEDFLRVQEDPDGWKWVPLIRVQKCA